MSIYKQLKTISHSFIGKLFGLIILLAFAIIVTILLFNDFISFDDSRLHNFFLHIIVILIFALAIYFLRRLLLPLSELNRGVKEISKGNLDVQINVKSKDEIGKLATAFNQMAKDLKIMVEAREQLLLDVSHELRTPITRSRLALEMIDESEYTTIVKRNLKEVEIMIKELLESHRLESGFNNLNITHISIKDLIEQIAKEYSNEQDGIKTNAISDNLYIEADVDLMKIVLRNVIDNALKYSSNNERLVEVSVINNEENITIQIEDYGQGLHPDEIEKVFEPFYRTDKSRSRNTGGYGLGLHLCKKIMNAHGGEININNKEKGYGLIVGIVNKKILK